MSILTIQNRYESNIKTEEVRPILYTQVLAILSNNESLTAREIARRIGRYTRQDIQPRLNELRDKYCLIQEDGKKYDEITKRNVTAYKLIKKKKEIL